MSAKAEFLGASKSESTLLVLFIPSRDRQQNPIEQDTWVRAALEMLGNCFGGATAFPQGLGVWRDEEQAGKLIFDEPVIIPMLHQRNCIGAERGTAALVSCRDGRKNQTGSGWIGNRPRLP